MKRSHAIADFFVVDDDPAAQRVMCRILGRSGYNVLLANSGQEAFDKIAANLRQESGRKDKPAIVHGIHAQ